jgi:zinc transport system ATP-binding protein
MTNINQLRHQNHNNNIPSDNALIIANNIGLEIANKVILSNISLKIETAKITTIIGPNGGGKTSLLRMLLGLSNVSSGNLWTKPKISIGYMPQKLGLEKTIPLKAIDLLSLLTNKSIAKLKSHKLFHKLTKKLKIESLLNNSVHQLSGGQMQKLILIQAIISGKELLILDEPTQYLDVDAIESFYQIISELRRDFGMSVVLVSHDLHSVMSKSDVVICINQHICCAGSAEAVNRHPAYLTLFSHQHHHKH